MRHEGVIYVAGHPLLNVGDVQNSQDISVPEMTYNGWGVNSARSLK